MPRKIETTFSGRRQEEVWFTDKDGLMGAYNLKDWYQGLSVEYQKRLLSIHHAAEEKSSLMMPWREDEMITGAMEIHRTIIERYAWQYSNVPPLLREIFELTFKVDMDIAQLAVNEWLLRAKKSKSDGAKFLALSAAIELCWSRGYTEAKEIRRNGLHNEDLKQVEKYASQVADLLKKQKLPFDINQCKPLDRLLLLYKLMNRKEQALKLIAEIEHAGYANLFEVVAYKNEFQTT